MDYPSIRREDYPDWDKKTTGNIFNSYIDVNSPIIMSWYPGYGVQYTLILQFQCTDMRFPDHSIYNTMFKKVIQK